MPEEYPQINLTFQGWCRRSEMEEAMVVKTGETVDLKGVSSEELVSKLQSGEWSISLVDAIDNAGKYDCEVSDYDVGA